MSVQSEDCIMTTNDGRKVPVPYMVLVDESGQSIGGNGALTTQTASPSASWQYAAASGGISNTTTAVTIAPAVTGKVNYLTALQIDSDALGAATEVAIRDGAAGAVIWRTKLGMAGYPNGYSVQFPVPLAGSSGNLLEVVTLTASVTGAVYVNAQGYTA